MSTGTGWQVPCRHASSNITTFQCGYRGMDDMHSPRATTLHVNAHCGTPEINEMPCNPRSYTPKGRVPVIILKLTGWVYFLNIYHFTPWFQRGHQPLCSLFVTPTPSMPTGWLDITDAT